MNSHHHIRPVERDCICLQRSVDGAHIADCNLRFKAKFFGSWLGLRRDFYAEAAGRQLAGAVHGPALLN